jgi:hypothetical protein
MGTEKWFVVSSFCRHFSVSRAKPELRFGCGFAALGRIAELHSARCGWLEWAVESRGPGGLQIRDTAGWKPVGNLCHEAAISVSFQDSSCVFFSDETLRPNHVTLLLTVSAEIWVVTLAVTPWLATHVPYSPTARPEVAPSMVALPYATCSVHRTSFKVAGEALGLPLVI